MASGIFKADSVLAKHDETYMPKEVADALKKQGHWKERLRAVTTRDSHEEGPSLAHAMPQASR